MEEQEKTDVREHLIGWIDTFLKDGIVPHVVNPKAIRANYIPKSKIKEIRDKAEVMDYYTLPDVIDDLNKLLEV